MIEKNKDTYITIDLGASSGRVIVSEFDRSIVQTEIHRFKNEPIKENDHLVWDFNYLMSNIMTGLKKAFNAFPKASSIGIDTWGCDYSYLDENGLLLRNPIAYRDTRTVGIEDISKKYFNQEVLYMTTGIQFLRFNTIYQIASDLEDKKEVMDKAKTFLMLPDLIAYYLTNQKRLELTNLSTTNFYNPNKKAIIESLEDMGFNLELLPKLIQPAETYGFLSFEVAEALSIKPVPVVAVCSHDTASAITSLDIEESAVYISSGTWSLIGKLLDKPLINEVTYKANYSNEIGYDHKIRFLKNISGFWIKNQIIKAFYGDKQVDLKKLDDLILKEDGFDTIIDLDDEVYSQSDNILHEMNRYAIKTNQAVPDTIGTYLKTFNNSLVSKYKEHITTLEILTGIKTSEVIIIGGGSQNDLLNQMTADMLCIHVIKGEKEATSLGNALVQHKAKHMDLSLSDIKKTYLMTNQKIFKPNKDLSKLYKHYQGLMEGAKK